MPTDLNGTPTPLGIGTYDVDADAPSGLGFNEAMLQIDGLVASRVGKPAGIAAGEVPVWNGSSWDRSSVTKIGFNSLAFTGTPTGTKFLRDDGSWQSIGPTGPTITYATTPPGSPATGDIWFAVDSTTSPTYQWQFRWNGGSSNTDKWEFVGGAPLYAIVSTAQSTTSTGMVDLATPGPTITVPRAGVYAIRFGAQASGGIDNGGGGQALYVGPSINGGAAGAVAFTPATGNSGQGAGTIMFEGGAYVMTAGGTFKLQYGRSQNGVGTSGVFSNRWVSAIPVRVS